ncbi:hypothetical protein TWF191_005054 [Orbilia oligospora]|uniref:Uncharacterized protein n=1 Tax=Orbilia oligospora TaxID=2813651 RepID=A0A7C8Q5G0_ORBOL|nr:hypothetical protein TWF191_005054 [Orbilia oligospora]
MSQIPSITVRVVNRAWIKENPDNVNTNNHKHYELPARLQGMEQALDQSEYYRRLTETGYDLWKPILQRMQREAKEIQEPTSPCDEGYEIILTPSLFAPRKTERENMAPLRKRGQFSSLSAPRKGFKKLYGIYYNMEFAMTTKTQKI